MRDSGEDPQRPHSALAWCPSRGVGRTRRQGQTVNDNSCKRVARMACSPRIAGRPGHEQLMSAERMNGASSMPPRTGPACTEAGGREGKPRNLLLEDDIHDVGQHDLSEPEDLFSGAPDSVAPSLSAGASRHREPDARHGGDGNELSREQLGGGGAGVAAAAPAPPDLSLAARAFTGELGSTAAAGAARAVLQPTAAAPVGSNTSQSGPGAGAGAPRIPLPPTRPPSAGAHAAAPATHRASVAAGTALAAPNHQAAAAEAGSGAGGATSSPRARYRRRHKLPELVGVLDDMTEAQQEVVARWAKDGEPFSFAVRNKKKFCMMLYGSGEEKKWNAFVRLCTDYRISRKSTSATYAGWTLFDSDAFRRGITADAAARIPNTRPSRSGASKRGRH